MTDESNNQPESSSSPRIGDTRPAPQVGDTRNSTPQPSTPREPGQGGNKNRRRGGRGRGAQGGQGQSRQQNQQPRNVDAPVEASAPEGASTPNEGRKGNNRNRRRGGERRTRAQGRYLMCVHSTKDATHIATLEGRSMVEYTVAKAADETNQIDGNIYVGRIQNVLPGMELAFVDIGIPKNAVLYRADISIQDEDIEG